VTTELIEAIRIHDFEAGHRVYGHEGKCANAHGHSYRVHIHCTAQELDHVGRVIDFSMIKALLCQWIEENWDHKFLLYEKDPCDLESLFPDGVVRLPINPTAENLASYLLNVISPAVFAETGIRVVKVKIEETRKCSASARAAYPRQRN